LPSAGQPLGVQQAPMYGTAGAMQQLTILPRQESKTCTSPG
jgi:hypothetical protein